MQITHSSDYFPQLYKLAVELIRRGHAYVDHQTAEEIKTSRRVSSYWPCNAHAHCSLCRHWVLPELDAMQWLVVPCGTLDGLCKPFCMSCTGKSGNPAHGGSAQSQSPLRCLRTCGEGCSTRAQLLCGWSCHAMIMHAQAVICYHVERLPAVSAHSPVELNGWRAAPPWLHHSMSPSGVVKEVL